MNTGLRNKFQDMEDQKVSRQEYKFKLLWSIIIASSLFFYFFTFFILIN